MKLRALLIVVVGLCVAADKKDDKGKDAKSELNGRWKIESLERGGVDEEGLAGFDIFLEYADGKITIDFAGQLLEGTYKIDPTKKPKTLDTTMDRDGEQQTTLGIYELKDDTLKICRSEPGADRPKEFKTSAEDGNWLMVLKKQKKDK